MTGKHGLKIAAQRANPENSKWGHRRSYAFDKQHAIRQKAAKIKIWGPKKTGEIEGEKYRKRH